jgi:hypothetical protein
MKMSDDFSFEEFQVNKAWCDDLGKALSDARWEDTAAPAIGWLYLDALYIEAVQPWWPEAAREQGKWYLVLGRAEWISDSLEELERRLYEWACREGYLQKVI